ncbi:hypothetical protein BH10ACT1_BH10ACT1_42640 [soil metagenome]
MELDDHGARAAEALRRRTQGIDVVGARAAVAEARHRRRTVRRGRLASSAIALFAVLGLVAAVVVAGNGPGDRFEEGNRRIDTDQGREDRTKDAAAAQILNAMPSSPIDGKASWRLPVIVKPQTGVHDGDTVTVYGRGFGPGESLGIVMCSSEADTSAQGAGACQLEGDDGSTYGGVTYATASDEGTVVADVVVHRFVTLPDGNRVDCQSAAERCLIGMGAVSNYDKSGGSYIGFAGQPDFPEPTLVAEPAGPYRPGQAVHAQVGGLVPGRSVRIQQCRGTRCQNLIDGKADPTGAASLAVTLQPSFVDTASGETVECEGQCVLRANGIGVKGASSAPLPPDVALEFTSQEPSAPVTTTTAAPGTSGADVPTTEGTATTVAPTTSAPVDVEPPPTDVPVTTTSAPPKDQSD